MKTLEPGMVIVVNKKTLILVLSRDDDRMMIHCSIVWHWGEFVPISGLSYQFISSKEDLIEIIGEGAACQNTLL